MEFNELEKIFFEFRKSIKLNIDITPVNLKTEKQLFIDLFNKNEVYNPYFQYDNNDHYDKLPQFEYFKNEFSNKIHPFSPLYIRSISNDIDWITQFAQRSDSFAPWLSSIYNRPEKKLVEYALEQIETYKYAKPQVKNISPEAAKSAIEQYITDIGFKNWHIKILNLSSRMSVNSLLRELRISDAAVFSAIELERLFVHEIGTHIWRSENGSIQSSLLFQFGFPDYLEAEEGLAIYAEEKNGLRDDYDTLRYCMRFVLCDLCFENDFYSMFKFVAQYFDNDTAFDIVARVKRGLIDTSELGGYTKDQVYLKGYLQIRDLPKEILKKLYVGKISIQDLQLIEESKIELSTFNVPKWIENNLLKTEKSDNKQK